MKTLYPGATYRPLGPQTAKPLVNPNVIIFHTMAGSLLGTDGWFKRGNGEGYGGTESHVGIGGATDGALDGAVYQWQDFDHRADAQLEGNHRAYSLEFSDGGKPSRPFSPKQLQSGINVGAWLCKRSTIPPTLAASSARNAAGISYHRMGIDPYRKPGGEHWSKVRGKECPGNARVEQVRKVIAPRVYALVHGYPSNGGSGGVVKPGPIKTIPARIRARLVVDGDFGPRTVKALQKALGVAQDGLMGPRSTKALQRRLGVPQTGRVDTVTILAAQRRWGLAHRDGIWGPLTTKALQRALNAGRL